MPYRAQARQGTILHPTAFDYPHPGPYTDLVVRQERITLPLSSLLRVFLQLYGPRHVTGAIAAIILALKLTNVYPLKQVEAAFRKLSHASLLRRMHFEITGDMEILL